jgi:cellulose synthase/poly-beta-1,6-N-acetylglucosamine synthase-like glycosyltransferase
MLRVLERAGHSEKTIFSRPDDGQITVIVPAYNEAASLADTINSLLNQTLPPTKIIVDDDCSTDATGDIARDLRVTVVRPPTNTGSKAGAQTYALPLVASEYGLHQRAALVPPSSTKEDGTYPSNAHAIREKSSGD